MQYKLIHNKDFNYLENITVKGSAEILLQEYLMLSPSVTVKPFYQGNKTDVRAFGS